jgi:tRNA-specific 2-thiouridylase
LPNLLFPLGDLTKGEVRRIYHAAGLPIRDKQRESMELCFLPEGNYQDFLQARQAIGPPWDFIDSQGHLLGRHRGLECYTVGQRRGLGIGRTILCNRDSARQNQVVLGIGLSFTLGLLASQMNWLITPPPQNLRLGRNPLPPSRGAARISRWAQEKCRWNLPLPRPRQARPCLLTVTGSWAADQGDKMIEGPKYIPALSTPLSTPVRD